MFSHLVTTEIDEQHKTVHYKIEFKHDKRIIKTVYINGNDSDWSKNLMSEINKFYRDDAPEFEKKLTPRN